MVEHAVALGDVETHPEGREACVLEKDAGSFVTGLVEVQIFEEEECGLLFDSAHEVTIVHV